MKRVIAYIDGFNLYFGLREKGWRRYYWLDACRLVQNLLLADQVLVMVKYFTARVVSDPAKQKRQSTFIEALETLPNLQVLFGKYQLNPRRCNYCGTEDTVPNEKMTDVQIATEMLSDAFADRFDVALLLSADSDLVPPVNALKELSPNKVIVAAFPPARYSTELAKVAHAHLVIGRATLKRSLLPDRVVKKDGFVLECPSHWKEHDQD